MGNDSMALSRFAAHVIFCYQHQRDCLRSYMTDLASRENKVAGETYTLSCTGDEACVVALHWVRRFVVVIAETGAAHI